MPLFFNYSKERFLHRNAKIILKMEENKTRNASRSSYVCFGLENLMSRSIISHVRRGWVTKVILTYSIGES